MRYPPLIALALLSGCGFTTDPWYRTNVQDVDGDGSLSLRFGGDDCADNNPAIVHCDADNDGVYSVEAGGDDCDDRNASVHPEAPEICDGLDNDCDGAIDNDDPSVRTTTTFFVDTDGDGYGDPSAERACQEYANPSDTDSGIFTSSAGDCDDTNPEVFPGATELCDGFDNNCDGETDDVGLWFIDHDNDGFGLDGSQVSGACDLPAGQQLAAAGGDCDDTDPTTYPGAPEVPYDSTDQNCNGNRDNWDLDLDNHIPSEHWAAANAANSALPTHLQWPITEGDCDDTNSSMYVGNTEICDTYDNDCDGGVDEEDLLSAAPADEPLLRSQIQPYFIDADGDGHFGTAVELCPVNVDPALHQQVADDCFDGGTPPPGLQGADPTQVFSGAAEICDGIDNDCDGRNDWSFIAFLGSDTFYTDADHDGYGVTELQACRADRVAGIAAVNGDCDDGAADVHPDAIEVCGDPIRQDCSTASIWDCDGDGYEGLWGPGNGAGEDCDDLRAAIFPSDAPGAEICDGLDNDCDGLIDSADPHNLNPHEPFWYTDADADGWGIDDGTQTQSCDQPAGRALAVGDCDDTDPHNHPDLPWYADTDGDGFGDPDTKVHTGCLPPDPTGWVHDGTDCNDLDPAFNPDTRWVLDLDGDFLGDPQTVQIFCLPSDGQPWVLQSNGNDCDDSDPHVFAELEYYRDADGDGVGTDLEIQAACAQPAGFSDIGGDCDDTEPTINPFRDERCNGIDDDCDGAIDDADASLVGTPGGPVAYQDLDQDGIGSSVAKTFCVTVPQGWVQHTGDCDDDNPQVYPGQTEVCGDHIDNDCDGAEQIPLWFADTDGDGWGAGSAAYTQCDQPIGQFVSNASDCDDAEPLSYPGAAERSACDGIDDDCDSTDEPIVVWYFDADADGLGDPDTATHSCAAPTQPPVAGQHGTWIDQGGDCDDSDAAVTIGQLWYFDSDGDGVGAASTSRFDCPQQDPHGNPLEVWLFDDLNHNGSFDLGDGQLSIFNTDCADDDPLVHPDAPEVDGDGVDSNCDGEDNNNGSILWYVDTDDDGYGDEQSTGSPTYAPGLVANHTDCNDNNPSINPGYGIELCDGLDNDCDGANIHGDVDVSNPFTGVGVATSHPSMYFGDADGDGLTSAQTAVFACHDQGVTPQLSVDGRPDMQLLSIQAAHGGEGTDCDSDPSVGYSPLFLRDTDGDGVGAWESPADMVIECPGTPYSGPFVPHNVHDSTDCDPTDPLRFMTTQPGEYADEDGDGFIAAYTEPGSCVGAVATSPGPDCNDFEVSFNPSYSINEFEIESSEALAAAIASCADASLHLTDNFPIDLDPALPSSTLVFRGDGPQGCSDSGNGICTLVSLSTITAPAEYSFVDMGIRGNITADAGTLVFQDTNSINLILQVSDSASMSWTGGKIIRNGGGGITVTHSGTASFTGVEFKGGDAAVVVDSLADVSMQDVRFAAFGSPSRLSSSQVPLLDNTGGQIQCESCRFDTPGNASTLIRAAGGTSTFVDLTVTVPEPFAAITPAGELTIATGSFIGPVLTVNQGTVTARDLTITPAVSDPIFDYEDGSLSVDGVRVETGTVPSNIFETSMATLTVTDLVAENVDQLLLGLMSQVEMNNMDIQAASIRPLLELAVDTTFELTNSSFSGTAPVLLQPHGATTTALLSNVTTQLDGQAISIIDGASVFVEDSIIEYGSFFSPTIISSCVFPCTDIPRLELDGVRMLNLHNTGISLLNTSLVIDHSLLWSESDSPLLTVANDGAGADQTIFRTTFHGGLPSTNGLIQLTNEAASVIVLTQSIVDLDGLTTEPFVVCTDTSAGDTRLTNNWVTNVSRFQECPSNFGGVTDNWDPDFNPTTYTPQDATVRYQWGELSN